MLLEAELIQSVWEKARAMPDRAAPEWRKDECGAWIERAQYENALSEFGWKIENVSPGKPDTLENLRPFHVRNGFDIANHKPRCAVTADRADIAPTQHVGTPRNRDA
jgi:hypothetical protein